MEWSLGGRQASTEAVIPQTRLYWCCQVPTKGCEMAAATCAHLPCPIGSVTLSTSVVLGSSGHPGGGAMECQRARTTSACINVTVNVLRVMTCFWSCSSCTLDEWSGVDPPASCLYWVLCLESRCITEICSQGTAILLHLSDHWGICGINLPNSKVKILLTQDT